MEDYNTFEEKIHYLSQTKNIIKLSSATCIFYSYLYNNHYILIIKGQYKFNIYPFIPNNINYYHYTQYIKDHDSNKQNINWELCIDNFNDYLKQHH